MVYFVTNFSYTRSTISSKVPYFLGQTDPMTIGKGDRKYYCNETYMKTAAKCECICYHVYIEYVAPYMHVTIVKVRFSY